MERVSLKAKLLLKAVINENESSSFMSVKRDQYLGNSKVQEREIVLF
jgi:hypothetical protein